MLLDYLKHPQWRNQQRWRRMIFDTLNRLGLTGAHALPLNRRWIDIHRRPMPLTGLSPAHEGLRLVQISDLHYSPMVWRRYLIQFIRWINEIEPDLVVVTGDLITGGYRFAQRVATILSHLHARHGVICTFGNHDYSIYGKSRNGEGHRRADFLQQCLVDRGLIVLRNEVFRLPSANGDKPLVLVGLDDEWTGRLDADRAFAGVSDDHPIICLNHNPVNTRELLAYPWQWMLAGHTHGRQVATSKFGRTFYPKRFRHFTHGYYRVENRHLYVNRGLSYGQRGLHWCRPEITVFKLRCAAAGELAEAANSAEEEVITHPGSTQRHAPAAE